MCSELHTKIGKREETVCIVETLLVFTVAALHFAVVMWRVWADQFVPDPKARSGQFNASKPVFLVSREMVGKLNTIPYTTAFEPGYHFLQKIGGGIGTLLRVSPKIAKTCISNRRFLKLRVLLVDCLCGDCHCQNNVGFDLACVQRGVEQPPLDRAVVKHRV